MYMTVCRYIELNYFDYPIYLKQWGRTGPKSFSIFASKFFHKLNILDKPWIQFNSATGIMHNLLVADDMALISDTISGQWIIWTYYVINIYVKIYKSIFIELILLC